MDFFLSLKYKPKTLQILNRCRIYLQVITLADITSADGTQIIPQTLKGHRLADRKSNLKWPKQQSPTREDWILWSSALQQLQMGNKLKIKLTTWTSEPHQFWFWYMDTNLALLFYHPNDTAWYSATPHQSVSGRKTRSANRPSFLADDITATTPPDSRSIIPVSINREPNDTTIYPTQHSFFLPTPSTTPPTENTTLQSHISSNSFYNRLVGPLTTPKVDGLLIAESIKDGSLLACCDGSYSPVSKLSLHGWVIADQTSIFWNGAGPVDGHKHLTSAYRAELGGFVATLHILHSICTFYQITNGAVIIYGDCLSAINKLQKKSYGSLKDYLVANFDLLNDRRILLEKLKTNISVTLHWVKGHSTGNKKSRPQILNDIAHSLAYEFLNKDMGNYNSSTTVIDPPSLEASVIFDGSSITSNMASILQRELQRERLQDTICKAENWSKSTFRKVDWVAYGKAFRSLSRVKQISISKLSHKLLNTNHLNQKFYGLSGACSCCEKHIETFSHMLTCSNNHFTPHYKDSLDNLQSALCKAGSPVQITMAIIHGISKWCSRQLDTTTQQKSPTIGTLNPLDIIITQAYTEQTTIIGWDNLLRGRLSVLWDKAVAMATQTSSATAPTSTGLVTNIIHLLWDYSQSIWKDRNEIIHGNTLEEAKSKETELAQNAIMIAFREYNNDPFIIPSHLRYLFTSKSLTHRLHQDIDSMHCWLRSYTEAKLDQQRSTQQYAEAAKKFFQPKTKPNPKDVNNAEETTSPQPKTQDIDSSTTFTSHSTILSSSSATSLSISSSETGDQPTHPSSISIM